MKKTHFLLTLLIAFVMSTMITGTSKAKSTYDSQVPVKESFSRTFNGVERTIIISDNADNYVWLKIGNDEPIFITFDVKSIGFDRSGTIWYVPTYNYVHYVNTDLHGTDPLRTYSLVKSYASNGLISEYIDDAVSLKFDDQNYVVGYNTLSGELRPILTLDEIIALYPPKKDDTSEPTTPSVTPSPMPTVTPTPNDVVTPRPTQTPVPTTPAGDPGNITNPQPTSAPIPNTVGNKVKMGKKGAYTYLYKNNTMIVKFRFKSSALKWTVRTKSGKLKSGTVKKVKSMSVIKKSSNIIYLSKNKRVYIISQKTGKKKLLAKNVKKLVKKGKYAVKIKKANGKYVSVLNK